MGTTVTAVALACPDCGAPMKLKGSRHGLFYGCTKWSETRCRGSHGAHADGRPLGTPATRDTKDARIRAHAVFDQLWQYRGAKRSEAYRWMRKTMKLTIEQAHIGHFTLEQCDQLIGLVELELGAVHPAAARAVAHHLRGVTAANG